MLKKSWIGIQSNGSTHDGIKRKQMTLYAIAFLHFLAATCLHHFCSLFHTLSCKKVKWVEITDLLQNCQRINFLQKQLKQQKTFKNSDSKQDRHNRIGGQLCCAQNFNNSLFIHFFTSQDNV